jgi:hypothetical protein
VRGIPKLVIANDEAVAAIAWLSPLTPTKPGIYVIAFESVVIASSDTV